MDRYEQFKHWVTVDLESEELADVLDEFEKENPIEEEKQLEQPSKQDSLADYTEKVSSVKSFLVGNPKILNRVYSCYLFDAKLDDVVTHNAPEMKEGLLHFANLDNLRNRMYSLWDSDESLDVYVTLGGFKEYFGIYYYLTQPTQVIPEIIGSLDEEVLYLVFSNRDKFYQKYKAVIDALKDLF